MRFFQSVVSVILLLSVHSVSAYDFDSDSSVERFVSQASGFANKSYEPKDLVVLKSSKTLAVSKKASKLRKEAADSLSTMSKAFKKATGRPLAVVSAYRSYDYQVGIKKRGCPDAFCAKAGHSEHQTWLAVDFFETTTQKAFFSKRRLKNHFAWLSEHAADYGFHNSYSKGANVDGYLPEPWHWRYLGVPLAKELKANGESFAEHVVRHD